MTWDDFQLAYPNLAILIMHIKYDNDMVQNSQIIVPEFLVENLVKYEQQASQLDDQEKEDLAMGGDDEREPLLERTGFTQLDSFLAEVFDGCLYDIFWNRA